MLTPDRTVKQKQERQQKQEKKENQSFSLKEIVKCLRGGYGEFKEKPKALCFFTEETRHASHLLALIWVKGFGVM